MDEQTTACLHSGIDQLVILGAGFDSRAYRLMTPEAGVTVFELDHPATQSVKKAKLKEVLQQLPAHVVFVPIDFNRDDLTTTLNKSGYNPNGKTLFIWEGVIYYLTAAAVVNTLSFITQHSGSGSSIIFDYFPQAVIDGTDGSRGAQKMCSRVKAWGEPFLFGIRDEELEPFLRERGFREIKTVAASSCKEAWFHGTNKDIVVSELFRFVHATHFCSKGGKHENE
jgi:methyltransferase (TIGR00027 family)